MRAPARSLTARSLALSAVDLRGAAMNPFSLSQWWYQAERGGSK
jgi:hypothetical protein